MLPRTAFLAGAGLTALVCACSPTTLVPTTPVLPLQTLRLYETGVGYFERSGNLTVSRGMSLPVPAGHLDDALKTLVVLDAGGKSTVHGVEFASSVSHGMARALAGLPVGGDESLDLQQLLVGLRGAAVEVHTHGLVHRGRLVEVVVANDDGVASKDAAATPANQKDERAKTASLTLLLLTDAGAIVRVPAVAVDSIRPLDPTWATRLGSALDALSTRGAESERLLRVMSQGAGIITLGYVAEIPVWRTTYRLVRGETGASVLQGWALLHNDTDEDWRSVRVELANGRPDSFLFPLAAPRYARRELVAPDDQLATVPQLMGNTVDALWGDHVSDSFGSGGLGLSGVGEGGGGRGEGIGLGSIGTIGHGGGTGATNGQISLLSVGNLAGTPAAHGVEAGALFVYTLADRVDLRAHGSALVPFVQQPVDSSAVAWFDGPDTAARSGTIFVNSTTQTLPAGPIAFFGDGGFAGEATLPRLKPGERRFLTYGLDLDVELRSRDVTKTEAPKRLVWNKGSHVLVEHYLRTSDLSYSIENRSGRPRSVVLSMSIAHNATLTGPDKVDFDAASSHPLAIFEVPAKKLVERSVHAVEGLERTTKFESLTSTWLGELAASPSLEAADRAAVTEAGARVREAEEDAKGEVLAKADIATQQKDLERIREEMKALSGEHAGTAQTNPFVARLLAAEDKLASLRKREDGLKADAKTKNEAAKVALAKLVR